MCAKPRVYVSALMFSVVAVPLLSGQSCVDLTTMQGSGTGGGTTGAATFHETWSPAVSGTSYRPDLDAPPAIRGSEGNWYLGATVVVADNTPHFAEVLADGDDKYVKLVSNQSYTSMADNIWLSWDARTSGRLQPVPITPDTRIALAESGELNGSRPDAHSWGSDDHCGLGTCGIYFAVVDANGNVVVYRLQAPSDAVERSDPRRVEILIEPENGVYMRNLYQDFQQIPLFNPTNAVVQEMIFEVNAWDETPDELGWATIDDIKIYNSAE